FRKNSDSPLISADTKLQNIDALNIIW
ncbi:hypothetical protein BMETH_31525102590451, partial [methanotrophic bacterial endosymbiont of Bathymodiolus sp.]